MSQNTRSIAFSAALVSAALLAACGGGGGGNSAGASAVPQSPATLTPTQTQSVSGKVVSCDHTWMGVPPAGPSPEPTAAPCISGAGLAGATVVIGGMPPAGVGGAAGGSPVNPFPAVTSAPDGSFVVPGVPSGTYLVQVSMPPGDGCAEGPYPNDLNATPSPAVVGFADSHNFAAFHGQVVISGATALPTIHLTSLTQDEWCMYQQILVDRNRLLGASRPSTDPVIDEYAQEAARMLSVAADTTGMAGDPNCQSGAVCLPPQLATQYRLNGGLFTFSAGAVFVNNSWQSSEFESMSTQFAGASASSPFCSTNSSWCSSMTQSRGVYIGASEGPLRGDFSVTGGAN